MKKKNEVKDISNELSKLSPEKKMLTFGFIQGLRSAEEIPKDRGKENEEDEKRMVKH